MLSHLCILLTFMATCMNMYVYGSVSYTHHLLLNPFFSPFSHLSQVPSIYSEENAQQRRPFLIILRNLIVFILALTPAEHFSSAIHQHWRFYFVEIGKGGWSRSKWKIKAAWVLSKLTADFTPIDKVWCYEWPHNEEISFFFKTQTIFPLQCETS